MECKSSIMIKVMIKTRFKSLVIKCHYQLLAPSLKFTTAVNMHILLGHVLQKVNDWMDIVIAAVLWPTLSHVRLKSWQLELEPICYCLETSPPAEHQGCRVLLPLSLVQHLENIKYTESLHWVQVRYSFSLTYERNKEKENLDLACIPKNEYQP